MQRILAWQTSTCTRYRYTFVMQRSFAFSKSRNSTGTLHEYCVNVSTRRPPQREVGGSPSYLYRYTKPVSLRSLFLDLENAKNLCINEYLYQVQVLICFFAFSKSTNSAGTLWVQWDEKDALRAWEATFVLYLYNDLNIWIYTTYRSAETF